MSACSATLGAGLGHSHHGEAQIQPRLQDLCEDVRAQLEHQSYSLDEIAARFSHRLVWIHPYPNGNGRLSRTMADLLVVQQGARASRGAAEIWSQRGK